MISKSFLTDSRSCVYHCVWQARRSPAQHRQAHRGGLALGYAFATMFGLFGLVSWFGGWEVYKGIVGFDDMLTAFLAVLFSVMGLSQVSYMMVALVFARTTVANKDQADWVYILDFIFWGGGLGSKTDSQTCFTCRLPFTSLMLAPASRLQQRFSDSSTALHASAHATPAVTSPCPPPSQALSRSPTWCLPTPAAPGPLS